MKTAAALAGIVAKRDAKPGHPARSRWARKPRSPAEKIARLQTTAAPHARGLEAGLRRGRCGLLEFLTGR